MYFPPYEQKNLYLLFHAVRESMRQLFQGASGSTIKFLTKHMLDEIPVWIPNHYVMDSFNRNCESIQCKSECLKRQMRDAKEARDRLLPKLMSGEIAV